MGRQWEAGQGILLNSSHAAERQQGKGLQPCRTCCQHKDRIHHHPHLRGTTDTHLTSLSWKSNSCHTFLCFQIEDKILLPNSSKRYSKVQHSMYGNDEQIEWLLLDTKTDIRTLKSKTSCYLCKKSLCLLHLIMSNIHTKQQFGQRNLSKKR